MSWHGMAWHSPAVAIEILFLLHCLYQLNDFPRGGRVPLGERQYGFVPVEVAVEFHTDVVGDAFQSSNIMRCQYSNPPDKQTTSICMYMACADYDPFVHCTRVTFSSPGLGLSTHATRGTTRLCLQHIFNTTIQQSYRGVLLVQIHACVNCIGE